MGFYIYICTIESENHRLVFYDCSVLKSSLSFHIANFEIFCVIEKLTPSYHSRSAIHSESPAVVRAIGKNHQYLKS